MWFAATYGDPKTRGGGSNVPAWTRDGVDPLPAPPAGLQGPLGIPAAAPRRRPLQPRLQARTRPRRHRDLPARPARRAGHAPDAERPAGLGFPRQRVPGRQVRGLLPGEDGGAPAIWVMDADGQTPGSSPEGSTTRGRSSALALRASRIDDPGRWGGAAGRPGTRWSRTLRPVNKSGVAAQGVRRVPPPRKRPSLPSGIKPCFPPSVLLRSGGRDPPVHREVRGELVRTQEI